MGEQQPFLGLLPWNTSHWWLPCHFLIVLGSRAASLWEQLLTHHFRGSGPTWPGGHFWQSEEPTQAEGLTLPSQGGWDTCNISRWINTFSALSEPSAAFLLSPCARILLMSYCYHRAGWKGSCCALTSLCKGTVSMNKTGWDYLYLQWSTAQDRGLLTVAVESIHSMWNLTEGTWHLV